MITSSHLAAIKSLNKYFFISSLVKTEMIEETIITESMSETELSPKKGKNIISLMNNIMTDNCNTLICTDKMNSLDDTIILYFFSIAAKLKN